MKSKETEYIKLKKKNFKLKGFLKHNDNEGFSLIELVIVIAVLSILSAVAIPAFVGVLIKARQSAAIAFVEDYQIHGMSSWKIPQLLMLMI